MVMGLVTFVSGKHWQHLKIFLIEKLKFLTVSSYPCLIIWFVLSNILNQFVLWTLTSCYSSSASHLIITEEMK